MYYLTNQLFLPYYLMFRKRIPPTPISHCHFNYVMAVSLKQWGVSVPCELKGKENKGI